ncbi:MAG: hypothetical protein NXI20_19400 [bacterium]|nr:hypothetical protein [bacterium]
MKLLKSFLILSLICQSILAQHSVSSDTFPLQALIVKGTIKTSNGPIHPGDFIKTNSSVKIKKNRHLVANGSDGSITEFSEDFIVDQPRSIKKTWKGFSHYFLSDSFVRDTRFIDTPGQAVVRPSDFKIVNFNKSSNADRVYLQDSILIDWKTVEGQNPDTFNISIEDVFEDSITSFRTTSSHFYIHQRDKWFENEGNVVIFKIQAEGKRTFQYALRKELYPIEGDASYQLFLKEAIENERAKDWSAATYCFKMAILKAPEYLKPELNEFLDLHRMRYLDYAENYFDPYSY